MTAILLEADNWKRREPFVCYENIDGGNSAAVEYKYDPTNYPGAAVGAIAYGVRRHT